jgi:molecular chaperone HscB
MAPSTSSPAVQVCHGCGAGAPADVHFCPRCARILDLGRPGDYFAFLGVPRRLGLETADLDERFRALSRRFHPDYFHNAPPAERRASLERSSYLNDAYRTLRNPISRMEYLLGIEDVNGRRGDAAAGQTQERGATEVPPSLLEEVFALNEELDEVRQLRAAGAPPDAWTDRLEQARRPIEQKRNTHETELQALSAQWDALADSGPGDSARRSVLESIRARLLERKYIANLLAGIEREMSER